SPAKPWQTSSRRALAAEASFQLGKTYRSTTSTRNAFDDFAFAVKLHPSPPHSYKAKYLEAAGSLSQPDFVEFFQDCLKDDPLDSWSKEEKADVGKGFVAWADGKKANRARAEQLTPTVVPALKALLEESG